jgi:hypothetical protein
MLFAMPSKATSAFCALGLATCVSGLVSLVQALDVRAGVLSCVVSSGSGFVLGSSRSVNCTFSPPDAPPQHYVGTIDKLGGDIGYMEAGVLIWNVLAPTTTTAPGSLAGTYVVGPNALVGGSNNAISLLPLTTRDNGYVASSVSVANLTLHYEGTSYIVPSRIFAGPTQYPPESFAAYGIVAFTSRATTDDFSRHEMICRAYVAGLPHFSELDLPPKSQMVTVWPIDTNNEANQINELPRDGLCPDAVRHYGLATSLQAIASARASKKTTDQLNGNGPFLLAWSPAEEKGKPDAMVLVLDLSKVTTPDYAREMFRSWSTKIQQKPELWDNNKWDVEMVKAVARQFLDEFGSGVLQLVGGKQ